MKKPSFAIIFPCLSVIAFVLIPNRLVEDFVFNRLHVSGDGEDAMNDFYLMALAIRISLSMPVSLAILGIAAKALTTKR
ncbi:hypothetical protein [Burkholderia latens]|uniref:hypothetical protein n=1 Tax=Burkholderia latens TaxID=488446 RepID=UPI00158BB79B|nr:hypothetical protein [Burkholderia latens]